MSMEHSESKNSGCFDIIHPYKRELAARDGNPFPDTKVLSIAEGQQLCELLRAGLGIGGTNTTRDWLDLLYSRCNKITELNLDEPFEAVLLNQILDHGKILSESVIVMLPFTGGFDSGVRIARSDLIRSFDDIWYPTAEDLVVFDEVQKAILYVTHYGWVGSTQMSKNR